MAWALAAAWGWLFDGYETYALILVGAAAIRDLVSPDQLVQLPLYFGGLVGVTLVGWATGGLVGGVLTDYVGRRRMLMLAVLCYAVFTGMSALAQSYWMLPDLPLSDRARAGWRVLSRGSAGRRAVAAGASRPSGGALASAFGLGCLLAAGLWFLIGTVGHGSWRHLFVIGILPALFLFWMRRGVADPVVWIGDRSPTPSSAVRPRGRADP